MSLIEIKLKKDSIRNKLTTLNGVEINKNKYSVVDDEDKYVKSFLTYRNDLLIKDIKKKIKDSEQSEDLETFKEQ